MSVCDDIVGDRKVAYLGKCAMPKFGEENPHGKGGKTRRCNTLNGSVIGEGDIPTNQCIQILKKAGYDGFVTVEYECAEDCMVGIPRGLANLKTYIEQ